MDMVATILIVKDFYMKRGFYGLVPQNVTMIDDFSTPHQKVELSCIFEAQVSVPLKSEFRFRNLK